MLRIRKYSQLIIFLCLSSTAYTQSKFSIDLSFPETVNYKDINIYYDYGKGLNKVKNRFKQNKISISDSLYAKYATVKIEYLSSGISYSNSFWISEKPANIIFKINADNNLLIKSSQNVLESKKFGGEKLNNFVRKENFDLDYFLECNKNWQLSDSLINLFWDKKFKIETKKIEFVKQNPSLYYSFSLFRRELIYSHTIIDSLLKTYHQIFPDSFKLTTEGREILKILNGRNLKKNINAPNFSVKDTKNREIALKNYQGHFVLLTFWSTSCVPCIEELPAIAQIGRKYEGKLNIISISTDQNYKVFLKAIKKNKMSWTNIFGNIEDVIKSYGVNAIPQLYLIDTNGVIIYSREEEKDFTPKLPILEAILKEKL